MGHYSTDMHYRLNERQARIYLKSTTTKGGQPACLNGSAHLNYAGKKRVNCPTCLEMLQEHPYITAYEYVPPDRR